MYAFHPFDQPVDAEGLRLRLPERSDIPALIGIWSDPSFNWLFPQAYDGCDPDLERVAASARSVVKYRSAVLIEDPQGNLLGTVHLNNLWQDTSSIGWYVAPEHRRQGVATRAVTAAMLHLLNGHSIVVDAKMDEANEASRGLAEKIGLVAVPCSWKGSLAFATNLGAQRDRLSAEVPRSPVAA